MLTRRVSAPRPLSTSLSRFTSAFAIATVLGLAVGQSARAAVDIWDGGGGDSLWANLLNWNPDGVPSGIDDLVFGTGTGVIQLSTDRTANSLTFTNPFTLG